MKYVMALTNAVNADKIKISDETWNLKISKGETFVVDENRANRLLAQRVKGKPVVRVIETIQSEEMNGE